MPPPEDGVITQLNRKRFNSNAVQPAAQAVLRTTEQLLAQTENDRHGSKPTDGGESVSSDSDQEPVTCGEAQVGDFIQRNAGGYSEVPSSAAWQCHQ